MTWGNGESVESELEQTWGELKRESKNFLEKLRIKAPDDVQRAEEMIEAMRRAAFTHDSSGLDAAIRTFKEFSQNHNSDDDGEILFDGEDLVTLINKYWNLKYLNRPEDLK